MTQDTTQINFYDQHIFHYACHLEDLFFAEKNEERMYELAQKLRAIESVLEAHDEVLFILETRKGRRQ